MAAHLSPPFAIQLTHFHNLLLTALPRLLLTLYIICNFTSPSLANRLLPTPAPQPILPWLLAAPYLLLFIFFLTCYLQIFAICYLPTLIHQLLFFRSLYSSFSIKRTHPSSLHTYLSSSLHNLLFTLISLICCPPLSTIHLLLYLILASFPHLLFASLPRRFNISLPHLLLASPSYWLHTFLHHRQLTFSLICFSAPSLIVHHPPSSVPHLPPSSLHTSIYFLLLTPSLI